MRHDVHEESQTTNGRARATPHEDPHAGIDLKP